MAVVPRVQGHRLKRATGEEGREVLDRTPTEGDLGEPPQGREDLDIIDLRKGDPKVGQGRVAPERLEGGNGRVEGHQGGEAPEKPQDPEVLGRGPGEVEGEKAATVDQRKKGLDWAVGEAEVAEPGLVEPRDVVSGDKAGVQAFQVPEQRAGLQRGDLVVTHIEVN